MRDTKIVVSSILTSVVIFLLAKVSMDIKKKLHKPDVLFKLFRESVSLWVIHVRLSTATGDES